MPTGYTAPLYEGEQSARDFILRCARAFGASREENLDVPPRPREADTEFYERNLSRARQELTDASGWTQQDADIRAQSANAAAMDRWQADTTERLTRLARFEAMRERVSEWAPPTEQHEGLKTFMLDQLATEIDYASTGLPRPVLMDGTTYKQRAIEDAERSIAHYEQMIEREVQSTTNANAWISALYDSLPTVPVPGPVAGRPGMGRSFEVASR